MERWLNRLLPVVFSALIAGVLLFNPATMKQVSAGSNCGCGNSNTCSSQCHGTCVSNNGGQSWTCEGADPPPGD
jgi:hypothetical protein